MPSRTSGSLDFVFQKIAAGKPEPLSLDGEKKKQARKWFRDAASGITSVDAIKLTRDASRDRAVPRLSAKEIGQMFLFWYDAKHKDKLPYWDQLPLIFPIEMYDDGFLGINLHYLPHSYRARLMDALYSTMSNDRFDQTTKLQISYAILKSAAKYRYFKPCVKRYLNGYVSSRFIRINPSEWDMCLMLPTERFQKRRKQVVWSESVNKVRGRRKNAV